ncbi:MAG: hypothetical protein KDJ38_05360 [Gammaproteobacteria bacterium]|nr:hypothetical protein [Gammaproteobacteria bacterium]
MKAVGEPGIRLLNRAYRYLQLNDVPETEAFKLVENLAGQLAERVAGGKLDQATLDALWQSVLVLSQTQGRAPGPQVRPRSLHGLPVMRGSIGYAEL